MRKAIGIILILLGIGAALLGGALAIKNREAKEPTGIKGIVTEVKQEYKRNQDEQDMGFLLLLGGTVSFVVGIILTASGSNKQIIIMGANGEVVEQRKIKRKLQNNKKKDNIIEPITAREVILNLNKIDGLYETKIIDSIEYQKRRNDVKEKIIINGITEDVDEFILQIRNKLTEEEVKGIFNVLKVNSQEIGKEKKKDKVAIKIKNNKKTVSLDEAIEILMVSYKMKNAGAIEETEYNERKNKLKGRILEEGIEGEIEEFVLELRRKLSEEILTNKEINQIFKALKKEILINEKINDGYEIIGELKKNKLMFINKIINKDECLERKDEIIKYFQEKCEIQNFNQVINTIYNEIDEYIIDEIEIRNICKKMIQEKKEVVLKLDTNIQTFIDKIQCLYNLWQGDILEENEIKELYTELIKKIKFQKVKINLKEDLEKIEKLFLDIKLDKVLDEQEVKEILGYKLELQNEKIGKLIDRYLKERKNGNEIEAEIVIIEIIYKKSKEIKIEGIYNIALKNDEEILTIYEENKNYFAKKYLEFKYRNVNDILDIKKIYKKTNEEIISELQKNKKEVFDKYDKEKKAKLRKLIKIAVAVTIILLITNEIKDIYIRRIPNDNYILKEIHNYYDKIGEKFTKIKINKKEKLDRELLVTIKGESTTEIYDKTSQIDIVYIHNGKKWVIKEEKNKKEEYIPTRELSDIEVLGLLEKESLVGKNGVVSIENMKIEKKDSFEDGVQKISGIKEEKNESISRNIEIEGELKFISEKWKLENLIVIKDEIKETLTESEIEKLKKDFIKGENLIEVNRTFTVMNKKIEGNKIIITINEVYDDLADGKIKNIIYDAKYRYDRNKIVYEEFEVIDESEEVSRPSNEKLIDLVKTSNIINKSIFTWDKAEYTISDIKYDSKNKVITAKINGNSEDIFSTKNKILIDVQYKFNQEWKVENIKYLD